MTNDKAICDAAVRVLDTIADWFKSKALLNATITRYQEIHNAACEAVQQERAAAAKTHAN